MAYSSVNVSALTDIPAVVSAFAIAQGWTVDTSTPSQPVFTLPTTDTLINFRLSATVSGVDHTLQWAANGSAVPTSTANARSPKLAPASGSTPVVPLPTKVHMFATPAPNEVPYLAMAIEYNPNLFRHLYLGRMNRLGNYSGGEVIAAQQGPIDWLSVSMDFKGHNRVQYLFNGRSSPWSTSACGGVHVSHADNPTPWRIFRGYDLGDASDVPANSAFGGYSDSFNDGYLANGEVNYYGVNPLVPINLFAAKPITGDNTFVPIGHPPGVRLVNMKNLDPGAQISVGGRNWRVFPAMAKRAETSMPSSGGSLGYWRTYETSHYVGYAYPET